MAIIQQIKDKLTGKDIYPITKTKAIYDDDCNRLDEIIGNYVYSHIGMVIHSTTLDTMDKVIHVYGGKTWEKIEGRFLLGQSSEYAINDTGGGKEYNNMPP